MGHGLTDILIPAAHALDKWYVIPEGSAYEVPAFYREWNAWTIGAIVLFIVVAVAGFLVHRHMLTSAWYRRIEIRVRPLRHKVVDILAVAMGVALLWSAWQGALFAPNLQLPETPIGALLRGIEGTAGIMMILGLLTVEAAGVTVALYGLAFFMFPALDVLEYVHILGIAAALLVFARGKRSLAWFFGSLASSTPTTRRRAFLFLRVMIGAALMIGAAGKYMNPDIQLRLLDMFPDLNPYAIVGSLGVPLSREAFVFSLAACQFIFGFVIAAGYAVRFTALLGIVLLVLSTLFYGIADILGNLPVIASYSVMFAFGDLYLGKVDKEVEERMEQEEWMAQE